MKTCYGGGGTCGVPFYLGFCLLYTRLAGGDIKEGVSCLEVSAFGSEIKDRRWKGKQEEKQGVGGCARARPSSIKSAYILRVVGVTYLLQQRFLLCTWYVLPSLYSNVPSIDTDG